MKNLKKVGFQIAVFSLAVLPVVALAQIVDTAPIDSLGDVSFTVTRIVNWLIGIFWVLAVAFVIWAAFLYLTAGGDEEKLKDAKQRVIYAIIAAAIALLATGIQAIVTNLLTGTT
ncbi:MAG: hypothetical protein AAB432_00975 [Patescibacteria group bacterium]